MKFKRICAVVAGILNILLAAVFIVASAIIISNAASCIGETGNVDTGSSDLDMLVGSCAGGVLSVFWFMVLLVFAIPAIVYIVLGIKLLKANGKKVRSIATPVSSIVFSVLCIGWLFYLSKLTDGGVYFAVAISSMAVEVLNIVMCSFAISGINQQNAVIRQKMDAEWREKHGKESPEE